MTDRNGWMPIESAPRDGTWFLAYLPAEGERCCMQAARYMNISNGVIFQVGQCSASDLSPVTHWRELPSPPAQEDR